MSSRQELAGGATEGLRWPLFYDLLVLVLTRGRDRAFREALLDLAELAPEHHVLDVGCGTGSLAISASRRLGPGSVSGTDISEPMLARARAKARRKGRDIAFRQVDACDLPFETDSFDRVLMTTVLHMVPASRRPDCIGEMARVLRSGGRALIVDYGGPLHERRSMAARHGRHGAFDLYALGQTMPASGFTAVETGALGWLDLHYVLATAA